MSSINRNSSTRSSAHATFGTGSDVAASASRPSRGASTPAYDMPITSRSSTHTTPGSSRRQQVGETSSHSLAQPPSTGPNSGRWRSNLSRGNSTVGGSMGFQRTSMAPSDEPGSSRWRASIARVASSVSGGSLCGSTTDVVENAHVTAAEASTASWRNRPARASLREHLAGAGFSPDSSRKVATAFKSGDFGPVLRANRSPSVEEPLEPNPTDPRIRFAAHTLSASGHLEVPKSWVASGINTDPQALAKSPSTPEYERWEAWQKSHPGEWA